MMGSDDSSSPIAQRFRCYKATWHDNCPCGGTVPRVCVYLREIEIVRARYVCIIVALVRKISGRTSRYAVIHGCVSRVIVFDVVILILAPTWESFVEEQRDGNALVYLTLMLSLGSTNVLPA